MKFSDIQALLKFKPPFVYRDDPPRVIDSNGVTILELRGYIFLSEQFPDGTAGEEQDKLGKSLARTLELTVTVHSALTPQELYTVSLETLQSLLTPDEQAGLATALINSQDCRRIFLQGEFKISPSGVLLKMFPWSRTMEGHAYWDEVYRRVLSTEEDSAFSQHSINIDRTRRNRPEIF